MYRYDMVHVGKSEHNLQESFLCFLSECPKYRTWELGLWGLVASTLPMSLLARPSISSFIKDLFLINSNYVCVWYYAHMCTGATEASGIRSPWSWVYSHPMWVLRTKVWVSFKSSSRLTTDNLSSHHHLDPCYPLLGKFLRINKNRKEKKNNTLSHQNPPLKP